MSERAKRSQVKNGLTKILFLAFFTFPFLGCFIMLTGRKLQPHNQGVVWDLICNMNCNIRIDISRFSIPSTQTTDSDLEVRTWQVRTSNYKLQRTEVCTCKWNSSGLNVVTTSAQYTTEQYKQII